MYTSIFFFSTRIFPLQMYMKDWIWKGRRKSTMFLLMWWYSFAQLKIWGLAFPLIPRCFPYMRKHHLRNGEWLTILIWKRFPPTPVSLRNRLEFFIAFPSIIIDTIRWIKRKHFLLSLSARACRETTVWCKLLLWIHLELCNWNRKKRSTSGNMFWLEK